MGCEPFGHVIRGLGGFAPVDVAPGELGGCRSLAAVGLIIDSQDQVHVVSYMAICECFGIQQTRHYTHGSAAEQPTASQCSAELGAAQPAAALLFHLRTRRARILMHGRNIPQSSYSSSVDRVVVGR